MRSSGGSEEKRGRAADDTPQRRLFTMHIDFFANDESDARTQAEMYAEAMGLLRTEIIAEQARVSPGCGCSGSFPVYCRVPGPDPRDVCLMLVGHRGAHGGDAGPTESWVDGDVPRHATRLPSWPQPRTTVAP